MLLTAGCGASTALDPRDNPDAGTDAPIDIQAEPIDMLVDPPTDTPDDGMDMDMDMDMGPPELEVVCSPAQQARPRSSVEVFADVVGGDPMAPLQHRWESLDGTLTPLTPNAPGTVVETSTAGRHDIRYTVTDGLGRTGTCVAVVAVVNGPPIAVCPDPIVGPAGELLVVEGQGFDDEAIVSFQWRLLSGSLEVFAPMASATEVQSFTAETHLLELTVRDTDGDTDSCTVEVRTTAPPILDCPPPIEAPTRQPVNVAVPGRDDTSIVRHAWRQIASPDGAGDALVRTRANAATVLPQRQGDYLFLYTATDTDGLSASCEVLVIGTPTPPMLECPDEVRTRPLDATDLAVNVVDDGEIVRFEWNLVAQPDGSGAIFNEVTRDREIEFTPDIAGSYLISVRAVDNDGQSAECVIPVLAVSDEGLRIEVFWDTATDMDTHLLNPEAVRWQTPNDCYYANCIGGGADWGAPGPDDDPSLDIDNTSGFGPENINVEEPADGVYRAGILAFSGRANATMRIYCGGSRLEPVATFGPVTVRDRELWRVADIIIDGPNCEIIEVRNDDGSRYIDRDTSVR